jgi:hypothetical protein
MVLPLQWVTLQLAQHDKIPLELGELGASGTHNGTQEIQILYKISNRRVTQNAWCH